MRNSRKNNTILDQCGEMPKIEQCDGRVKIQGACNEKGQYCMTICSLSGRGWVY